MTFAANHVCHRPPRRLPPPLHGRCPQPAPRHRAGEDHDNGHDHGDGNHDDLNHFHDDDDGDFKSMLFRLPSCCPPPPPSLTLTLLPSSLEPVKSDGDGVHHDDGDDFDGCDGGGDGAGDGAGGDGHRLIIVTTMLMMIMIVQALPPSVSPGPELESAPSLAPSSSDTPGAAIFIFIIIIKTGVLSLR